MIYHAAVNIAQAGYQKAYAAVQAEIRERINREGVAAMMAPSQSAKDKPLAPTGNLEAIEDLVYEFVHHTAICQPKLLLVHRLTKEAERLESLAKSV